MDSVSRPGSGVNYTVKRRQSAEFQQTLIKIPKRMIYMDDGLPKKVDVGTNTETLQPGIASSVGTNTEPVQPGVPSSVGTNDTESSIDIRDSVYGDLMQRKYDPTDIALAICGIDPQKNQSNARLKRQMLQGVHEGLGSEDNLSEEYSDPLTSAIRATEVLNDALLDPIGNMIPKEYIKHIIASKIADGEKDPTRKNAASFVFSSQEIFDICDRCRTNLELFEDLKPQTLKDYVQEIVSFCDTYNQFVTRDSNFPTLNDVKREAVQHVGNFATVRPDGRVQIIDDKVARVTRYNGIPIQPLTNKNIIESDDNVKGMNHSKKWPGVVFGRRLNNLKARYESALSGGTSIYKLVDDNTVNFGSDDFLKKWNKYQNEALLVVSSLDNMYKNSDEQSGTRKSEEIRQKLHALELNIAALNIYHRNGGPITKQDDAERLRKNIKDLVADINQTLSAHFLPIYEEYNAHRTKSFIALIVLSLVAAIAAAIAAVVQKFTGHEVAMTNIESSKHGGSIKPTPLTPSTPSVTPTPLTPSTPSVTPTPIISSVTETIIPPMPNQGSAEQLDTLVNGQHESITGLSTKNTTVETLGIKGNHIDPQNHAAYANLQQLMAAKTSVAQNAALQDNFIETQTTTQTTQNAALQDNFIKTQTTTQTTHSSDLASTSIGTREVPESVQTHMDSSIDLQKYSTGDSVSTSINGATFTSTATGPNSISATSDSSVVLGPTSNTLIINGTKYTIDNSLYGTRINPGDTLTINTRDGSIDVTSYSAVTKNIPNNQSNDVGIGLSSGVAAAAFASAIVTGSVLAANNRKTKELEYPVKEHLVGRYDTLNPKILTRDVYEEESVANKEEVRSYYEKKPPESNMVQQGKNNSTGTSAPPKTLHPLSKEYGYPMRGQYSGLSSHSHREKLRQKSASIASRNSAP